MAKAKPTFTIVGGLREDYFITATGEVHLREIGGNALYAAVGAALWSRAAKQTVGLITRVGENYPPDWIKLIERHGFDTRGVKTLSGPQDTRTFYAYLSLEERVDIDPAGHFARVGQPLPPELKDYASSTEGQEDRQKFGPLAVRPADVPKSFHDARGLHIAPCDYLTQRVLPEAMRTAGIKIVTCDPSLRYMQPGLKKEISEVVRGLGAFLPSEMEVRAYYRSDTVDLWEAAAEFGSMGCRIVVIKRGANGCLVYNAETGDKWQIPAYPVTVRDVTGAGDAFGGGFITGLAETGDPVEAALRGAVSASIVIEGVGALNGLEAHPDLPLARFNRLRESVRKL
ncbi:MAG TPA: carbohydrate kinase family protein [Anaerolineales bacterium]|nr:carbohydrate kinase family protein [Anaerolineales bacterium]